jgi:hypothetical protein
LLRDGLPVAFVFGSLCLLFGLIDSLWLMGSWCHGEQELHGVLPLQVQGKRPQDAGVQLCAPLQQQQQQHPPHHLEAGMPYHQGQPMQMVVPGVHQGQPLPAAYQAFVMPDTATLIDVQGSFIVIPKASCCTYCSTT